MIFCMILGHQWRPLRFQPSPDPRLWLHQCGRCGKSERIQ